MTNTEMRTELLERATRLEDAAKRCRQAAAILTTPEEPTDPWNKRAAKVATNGVVDIEIKNNRIGPPFLPVANGNGHHKTKPSPRRDRAVKALKKHGPLPPSTLGAYVGIHRNQVSAYAFPWIKSGHVVYDEKAYRYKLGPAAK